MRTRTVVLAVAGTTLAAVIISGCTSGSASAAKRAAVGAPSVAAGVSGAGVATAPVTQGVNLRGSTNDLATFGTVGGSGTGAGSGTAASASVQAVPGATTGTGGASGAKLVSNSESVIRRAQLTVGVKKASDVAVQANAAEGIVYKLGGDVYGDDRSAGLDATATLTLLVPPANLITALQQLSALGIEQNRTLSSENVTTQVADVNARLISAEASIVTLRTLFKQATKVGDVIQIEQELASRESDLESLKAQQKALNDETAKATISLVLTTAPAPAVVKTHHRSGIGGAFLRGWDHFVSGGAWVISAIAAGGPWALLLVLVGAFALRLWRRRASLHPAPTAEPTPEAA